MGETDLVGGRIRLSRRGWFVVASLLLLAACSGSGDSATLSTTTAAPGQTATTAVPLSATGTECRNALVVIDAYVLAKQSGRADDAAAAAARTRCLASPEVPPSCADAMKLSVDIGKLTADNAEFVLAYTQYGEASTLCRLKLLKSI